MLREIAPYEPDALACFQVSVVFQDGVPASVCGFCRQERRPSVERCFSSLAQIPFGVWQEGILVDSRFARLLAQTARPEKEAIVLAGGCVRTCAPDGPCGAVIGDLFQPSESAAPDRDTLQLSNGWEISLILRPGTGAAAFFCPDTEHRLQLRQDLSTRFPDKELPACLRRRNAGYLWVLDYAPDDPVRTGVCQVHLPEAYTHLRTSLKNPDFKSYQPSDTLPL